MRGFLAMRAAILLGLALAARPARAAGVPPDSAWNGHGLPVCRQPNSQIAVALARASDGAWLTAWEDTRFDPGSIDLYAVKRLPDGTVAVGWPDAGAPLSLAVGDQRGPQIAADLAGGVYAVWEDTRGGGAPTLYAQHLDAAGAPVSGWPANGLLVSGYPSIKTSPKLVGDAAGGILVFWEDYRLNQPRLYAQHLQSNGTRATGWADSGKAVAPGPGGQVGAEVVEDGAGGAYLAWVDGRGGLETSTDIFAQRLRGDGTPATGWPVSGAPVCTANGGQDSPALTRDNLGGIEIAWADPRSGISNIYAHRLTGLGEIAAGWGVDGVAVSNGEDGQFDPAIASDASGRVIVAWVDTRGGDGNADLYAQRLLADGSPTWATDGIALCAAAGEQLAPHLLDDGAGGALLGWQDGRLDPEVRVFAQHVTVTGAVAPGWPADGLLLADSNLVAEPPQWIADGAGGAIAAWSGLAEPDDGTAENVYAARVTGDGVVPVLASLVSAAARADGVTLRWWTPAEEEWLAIERAAEAAPGAAPLWREVATARAAGGLVEWTDRDVAPGERYGYRLRTREGPAGEAWVAVPFARLAIARAGPQPAGDFVRFDLSLAGPAAGRLEVFDVTGRRILAREIAGGASAVGVTLPAAGLVPGLYVARLAQAGSFAAARFAIVR